MRSARSLSQRLASGDATLVVIGAGYVGLTVASAAAGAGLTTHAVDTDPERAAELDAGRLVVPGVDAEAFAAAHATGRFRVGTDPSVVADADAVLICVPTPLIDHRPDLSAVEAAGRTVGEHLRAGTLVVLESTTYPGTTEQVLAPLLEAHGLVAGRDFLLAFSPERVNPGDDRFGFESVTRVVGGHTPDATAAAAELYGRLVQTVHTVSSCRAAELAKLLENTYRMVNIALVNELAQLCADQGIDTWEVIDAASTKPFGFQRFDPGPGVGGHCIPLDPAYLTWQTRRDTGRPFRLVELAKDINDGMPVYVARRIADTLNELGKPLKGAKLLALGVTYKADVGDVRESAAVLVLAHLLDRGADLAFHDPYVSRVEEHGVRLRRVRLTPERIAAADAVLLLTPHSSYDLAHITQSASLVFDARGATRRLGPLPNVVTL